MRCILACDLKGGIVVRGARGERDRYRPIAESSRIVRTSAPLDVVGKIRPKETYIADLDRIMGVGDHLSTIRALSLMTRTMADIGISSALDHAVALDVSGMAILGTETAPLAVIEQCQGPRMIVSLDMRHGRVICRDPGFNVKPLDAIKLLDGLELGAVILLDVGRVGSGEGVDFEFTTQAAAASRHEIIVGGGVRDASDLDLLERCGASGAIIASAVHDGRIPLSLLRD
jgi:phosphoribosylformimino-5-aminoimidazole carboxamide ribotide isomerase